MSGPTVTERLPVGPPQRPLTGNLRELARDRLGCLTRYAREHGDVVPLRLGMWRYLLVSHPSAIEEVLTAQSRHFVKGREYRLNKLTLGQGILTSEGAFWLRQRRLMQPAFGREAVRMHATAMVEAAQRAAGRWRPGTTVSLHDEMVRIALETAASALFGSDLGERATDVTESVDLTLARFRERLGRFAPLPDRVPTPANVRLRRAVRRLDRVVYDLIRRRRAGDVTRDDLLALLLAAREEDGGGMTDKQLRDELVTLLLAGHETTTNALVWTWYLLGRNPESEQRLADEVAAVLGGRAPTAADVPALPYANQVVQEVLRLYPPGWGFTRQAVRDCSIAGFPVRRGTHIAMCQWIVHRDPRWFDEPTRFLPERWDDSRETHRPRYAYFPFGGGQRACIGGSFAMLELVLVVASIVQRWRLEPVGSAEATPVASVTLRPLEDLRATVLSR